ncbi:hypothetical protein [Hymenobacter sp. 102]|uniref:hypothetical protein n=1 Tax=Hymenobacter sp. 102 TaxID=3403152 RepID=UPI003CF95CB3
MFIRLLCVLASFAVLSYALAGCTNGYYRSAVSPRQLGLNQIQHWRLKRFVGQQNSDRCGEWKQGNYIKAYRFYPTATSANLIGLVSIYQQNRSHSSFVYFINGKHRITPLDLKLVRCGPADYVLSVDTMAEKHRRYQVVEAALRRHAREMPDSLQQRIWHKLQHLWQ